MSLADDANLLLIPTGYKAEKLYSIFPTSGVGDFDFARTTSATRVAKNGFITTVGTNVPRLNYDILDGEVVGCPHLLLEPSRTNLIVNSEAISLSPIKNGTFTDNFAISPDGTQNATKLTTTDTDPFFYQSVSFSAGSYTASIYVKGIGGSIGKDFRIVLGGSSSNPKLEIPSEWTRFEYTATMTSGSANAGLEIPDPSIAGDEILVWGWQVEEGSFSSSYIPNYGTALGVTRAAETCNGSGDAATFNDSEGVLMAEIAALADDLTFRTITISDSSTSNNVGFGYRNNSNSIYTFLKADINSSSTVTVSDIKDFNKVAVKYKSGSFAMWINGFEQYTSSTAFSLSGLSELAFDNGVGAADFYGKTKQIQYHSTALSDSDLEKLSSWTSFNEMATAQLYTIQ